jgi:hypothetical protein
MGAEIIEQTGTSQPHGLPASGLKKITPLLKPEALAIVLC